MTIKTLGIDLAKNSFALVRMDNNHKIVLRKSTQPPAIIALHRSVARLSDRCGSLLGGSLLGQRV